MVIQLGNAELVLRADGSVYLPEASTLLVADLHLGKDSSFRAHAIPMPSGSDQQTLDRLSGAVSETRAASVVVLGDLWHQRRGTTERVVSELEDWIQREEIGLALVAGNHDRHAAPSTPVRGLTDLGARHELGGLSLIHDPNDSLATPSVCGHLHPGIRLETRGRQTLTVRAFWRRKEQLIIPAFGELTGRAPLRYEEGDDVFAIAGEHVFAVPNSAFSSEQRAGFRG